MRGAADRLLFFVKVEFHSSLRRWSSAMLFVVTEKELELLSKE